MADPLSSNLPSDLADSIKQLSQMGAVNKNQHIDYAEGRFSVIPAGGQSDSIAGLTPAAQEAITKTFDQLAETIEGGRLDQHSFEQVFAPNGECAKAVKTAMSIMRTFSAPEEAAKVVKAQSQQLALGGAMSQEMTGETWVRSTCPEMEKCFQSINQSMRDSLDPNIPAQKREELTPHNPGGTATGAFRVRLGEGKPIGALVKPLEMGLGATTLPMMAFGSEEQLIERFGDEGATGLMGQEGSTPKSYGLQEKEEGVRERMAYVASNASGLDYGVPPTVLASVSHPTLEGPGEGQVAVFKETLVSLSNQDIQGSKDWKELLNTALEKGLTQINEKVDAKGVPPLTPEEWKKCLSAGSKEKFLAKFEATIAAKLKGKNPNAEGPLVGILITGPAKGLTNSMKPFLEGAYGCTKPSKALKKNLQNLHKQAGEGGSSPTKTIASVQQWVQNCTPMGSGDNKTTDAKGELVWDEQFLSSIPDREWEKFFLDIDLVSGDRGDTNALTRPVFEEEIMSNLEQIVERSPAKGTDILDELVQAAKGITNQGDLDNAVEKFSERLGLTEPRHQLPLEDALSKLAFSGQRKETLANDIRPLLENVLGGKVDDSAFQALANAGQEIRNEEQLNQAVDNFCEAVKVTDPNQKKQIKNILTRQAAVNEIVLIDNAQSVPDPNIGKSHYRGQRVAFWMSVPAAKTVTQTGVRKKIVTSQSTAGHIQRIQKDQRSQSLQFKVQETRVNKSAYDLIRVSNLVKKFAANDENGYSLYDAGLVIYGETETIGHENHHYGRELGIIYDYHVQREAHYLAQEGETPKSAAEKADKDTEGLIKAIMETPKEQRTDIEHLFAEKRNEFRNTKSDERKKVIKEKYGHLIQGKNLSTSRGEFSEKAMDKAVETEVEREKNEYASTACEDVIKILYKTDVKLSLY